MDKKIAELTLAWLTKAQHDLIASKRLAATDDVTLDGAIYHCQQAGEKALKGYLTAQGHLIQKTHDLGRLVKECNAYEPSFQQWDADANLLSPLVSSFRYPDEIPVVDPTRSEFDAALAAAQRIYDFVLSLLPQETHPS